MGKNVHVVPDGGRWSVKLEKSDRPVSTHRTQELAWQNVIPVAKGQRSELIVHGRDGTIRSKDSYGNDPNPPKDKEH